MKKGFLKLQLLTIILACFIVQQTVFAQSSWKFKKATLSYVDFSDSAEITAQPVKTELIKLKKGKSADAAITVNLNNIVHPGLSGIGGAFNEQGGEAFMCLPDAERKLLAEALFSPTKGSGFSLCRTAVGSSDFGLSAYSYSEVAEGEAAIAVRNSNRLVVFVQNNANTSRTQNLNLDGKVYAVEIPAQSLCALILEK